MLEGDLQLVALVSCRITFFFYESRYCIVIPRHLICLVLLRFEYLCALVYIQVPVILLMIQYAVLCRCHDKVVEVGLLVGV